MSKRLVKTKSPTVIWIQMAFIVHSVFENCVWEFLGWFKARQIFCFHATLFRSLTPSTPKAKQDANANLHRTSQPFSKVSVFTVHTDNVFQSFLSQMIPLAKNVRSWCVFPCRKHQNATEKCFFKRKHILVDWANFLVEGRDDVVFVPR